jgi:hypothetical protein
LFIIFKLGNCTNPRADYEIQLVGAEFVYALSLSLARLFFMPAGLGRWRILRR